MYIKCVGGVLIKFHWKFDDNMPNQNNDNIFLSQLQPLNKILKRKAIIIIGVKLVFLFDDYIDAGTHSETDDIRQWNFKRILK